jgi:hypothetical protein
LTGSFTADPQTFQTASSTFDQQVDALHSLAATLGDVHFQGTSAGTDYVAQGNDYHGALTNFVQALVPAMATKASGMAQQLQQTGTDYDDSDQKSSARLRQSGEAQPPSAGGA